MHATQRVNHLMLRSSVRIELKLQKTSSKLTFTVVPIKSFATATCVTVSIFYLDTCATVSTGLAMAWISQICMDITNYTVQTDLWQTAFDKQCSELLVNRLVNCSNIAQNSSWIFIYLNLALNYLTWVSTAYRESHFYKYITYAFLCHSQKGVLISPVRFDKTLTETAAYH